MEIKVIDEGKPYVIALEGRLDTNTSPQLEEFAGGLYEKGVSDIAVDMAACDFVSSAGLRVLLSTQKKMNAAGGSLTIANAVPAVREVFDITGFSDILNLA